MPWLKLWNTSKLNKEYKYGTPALVPQPCFSWKDNHGDTDPLSKACSISFLPFLLSRALGDEYRVSGCVLYKRKEILGSFISGKVRSLSHCRVRIPSIVVRYPTWSLHTSIMCFTADTSFASEMLRQYEKRITKHHRVWLVVRWAWKGLFQWHKTVPTGQGWCNISRTFSIPLRYGASNMSNLLREVFCSSFWASKSVPFSSDFDFSSSSAVASNYICTERIKKGLLSMIHLIYVTKQLKSTACTRWATIAVLFDNPPSSSENILRNPAKENGVSSWPSILYTCSSESFTISCCTALLTLWKYVRVSLRF